MSVMKEGTAGVLGAVLSLPWCCILPGALALLGMTGVVVAREVAVELRPVLWGISALFLARAHYGLWIRRRGNRLSRLVVWMATGVTGGIWIATWWGWT